MIVEHLSLVDFRNYATAELSLQRGANVLIGRNGQGKTNLAEAIVFLATLGSHRVSSDAPLVRDGAEAAFVRARLAHGERSVLTEVQINKQGSNKARINGSPAKTNELPRFAHVVLFAPEDLQIVRGDPSTRRRFADQLLIQRTPRMASVLADYDRVLKQRTTLLKSARARGIRSTDSDALSTLDVWDDKLIEVGAQIISARDRLVADLRQPVRNAYFQIVGDDHKPEIEMKVTAFGESGEDDETAELPGNSSRSEGDAGAANRSVAELAAGPTAVATAFRATLLATRAQELERGLTLVGPHRDDMLLRIRDLPVRGYASHGESWSVALALRLASAELLRADSPAGDPVVILDDVFAELDAGRRERLAELVHGYEQVLVTAAVENDVPAPLRAHTVYVNAGTLSETASDFDHSPLGSLTDRSLADLRSTEPVSEHAEAPGGYSGGNR